MKIFLLFLILLPLSGFSQEEEFDDVVQDRREQMAKAAALNETTEKLKEESMKNLSEISLLDDKAIEAVQKIISESRVDSQSRDVVKSVIKGRVKGKPMEKVFETVPVLLEICTDVLRSKKAMSGLLNIFRRQEDLKLYGYISLFLIFMNFLIKRYLFPKDIGAFKLFFLRTLFNLGLTVLSFGIFYSFFSAEVDPLIKILKFHFGL